tara:strand:- start:2752 stop:3081 length:330 start_codon:yes stop_codon:yes gene_type:complete
VIGLYLTTMVMSVGFHYFETIQTSLSLQWIDTDRTAEVLGRIIAVGAFTSIVAFAAIWLAFDVMSLDFVTVYILGGGITAVIAVAVWPCFPQFPIRVSQRRQLILRKRY